MRASCIVANTPLVPSAGIIHESVDWPKLFPQPFDQFVNPGDVRQIELPEWKSPMMFALNLDYGRRKFRAFAPCNRDNVIPGAGEFAPNREPQAAAARQLR